MKTFIIINGTTLKMTEQKSMRYAREVAIAISDHSKEIVVKEITDTNKQALELLMPLMDKANKEKIQCPWNV